MVRPRHLKNAPIVEAIIDIRVKLPVDFNPSVFKPLIEKLVTKYTKVERGLRTPIEIKKNLPVIKQTKEKEFGYRFTSKDNKEVGQFRIDGFTFSRLQPYTNWGEVIKEAKRLWRLYRSKTQPVVVDKISVHYINRLEFPPPYNDYCEFLTAAPTLPDTLPQKLSSFLTSLLVREDDLWASILQTRVKSTIKDNLGIIIDIDTFKKKKKGIEEKDIWSTFDLLHELKNRIFFELITEKAVRLFE